MKFLRFWVPVAVWMGVIFFFSSKQRVSVSAEEGINFLFFKTLHIIEYAALFTLSFRAVKNSLPKKRVVQWGMLALVITILYAISDEVHQTFVPTREGAPRDVIIDALGGSIAWIGITQWLPKAPKKLISLAKRWQIL